MLFSGLIRRFFKENSKGNNWLWVVFLLLVGGGAGCFGTNRTSQQLNGKTNDQADTPSVSPSISSSLSEDTGPPTYTGESFRLPVSCADPGTPPDINLRFPIQQDALSSLLQKTMDAPRLQPYFFDAVPGFFFKKGGVIQKKIQRNRLKHAFSRQNDFLQFLKHPFNIDAVCQYKVYEAAQTRSGGTKSTVYGSDIFFWASKVGIHSPPC